MLKSLIAHFIPSHCRIQPRYELGASNVLITGECVHYTVMMNESIKVKNAPCYCFLALVTQVHYLRSLFIARTSNRQPDYNPLDLCSARLQFWLRPVLNMFLPAGVRRYQTRAKKDALPDR